jgi:hypothetical protein
MRSRATFLPARRSTSTALRNSVPRLNHGLLLWRRFAAMPATLKPWVSAKYGLEPQPLNQPRLAATTPGQRESLGGFTSRVAPKTPHRRRQTRQQAALGRSQPRYGLPKHHRAPDRPGYAFCGHSADIARTAKKWPRGPPFKLLKLWDYLVSAEGLERSTHD